MTQEKINIAKLLKNCPSGMGLDCTMIEGLEFAKYEPRKFFFLQ